MVGGGGTVTLHYTVLCIRTHHLDLFSLSSKVRLFDDILHMYI